MIVGIEDTVDRNVFIKRVTGLDHENVKVTLKEHINLKSNIINKERKVYVSACKELGLNRLTNDSYQKDLVKPVKLHLNNVISVMSRFREFQSERDDLSFEADKIDLFIKEYLWKKQMLRIKSGKNYQTIGFIDLLKHLFKLN